MMKLRELRTLHRGLKQLSAERPRNPVIRKVIEWVHHEIAVREGRHRCGEHQ